jgi:hypothetical protein
MRVYRASVVILIGLSGSLSAQPGGIGEPAATYDESSALGEPAAQEPQQPSTQVLDPATAPTRATFVSSSEAQWDVYVDQQAICSTPCTLGLSGVNFVALRTQERNPVRLDVGTMPQGDIMVRATPLSNGMYAGGIVMTTFAGMALATGITLTAVGYGTDRGGMQTAGLITGVSGAVGLYAGIYLMRKALPRFSIGSAQPYAASNQIGLSATF